ncbi:MAG: hypothetical protein FWC64_12585 [Treponema sp.]|nr:hypothetical protein [Treponema sp.]
MKTQGLFWRVLLPAAIMCALAACEPFAIVLPPPPPEREIIFVDMHEHTLLRKGDGTIWAWGSNFRDTSADRHSPTQIGLDVEWAYARAISQHAVAVARDGSVWTWGRNRWGELGDGTRESRHVPTLVIQAGSGEAAF